MTPVHLKSYMQIIHTFLHSEKKDIKSRVENKGDREREENMVWARTARVYDICVHEGWIHMVCNPNRNDYIIENK